MLPSGGLGRAVASWVLWTGEWGAVLFVQPSVNERGTRGPGLHQSSEEWMRQTQVPKASPGTCGQQALMVHPRWGSWSRGKTAGPEVRQMD